MGLDISALRQATPASSQFTYFNNGSASLMPASVLSAMTEHLQLEAANGVYEAADQAADRLEGGYSDAATLLGCEKDEIAFTTSTTQGWRTIVETMRLGAGDVVLVGESEWGGNYGALLHIADRTGCNVEVIPSTADGTISLDALTAKLDSKVKLICLTWVASGTGTVQPAARVGTIARNAGIPFVLDAAQAIGQLPSDVRELGCDALMAPARKWLRGPLGGGLLYVRRAFAEIHPPLMVDYVSAPIQDGRPKVRNDARCYETAELSVAVRVGICAALREHLALGPTLIHQRIRALSGRLRNGLRKVPGITVQDVGTELAGLVTFSSEVESAAGLRDRLAARGVVVKTTGVAHTPLDFGARGLREVVRASPHVFNTEDEVDRVLRIVNGDR